MNINNLTKAKTALILDQPFFASLLFGMQLVEDNSIKTMAVDGETIRYNADFVSGLSIGEIQFVLSHEVMHCALEHMYRKSTRDHNKWNIAADYAINEILCNEGIGTMPKGCLKNSQLFHDGGGTAEGIYNALPDNPQGGKQGEQGNDGQGYPEPGEQGGSLDDCQEAQGDASEQAQKQAEMKVRVIQAANAAKMQGKLSGTLRRFVNEVTQTKVNWKDVLRNFFNQKSKEYASYSKPKRRFLADDIMLPGMTGEKLGEIVVAVDCSGSINEHVLNMFSAEIKSIFEETAPSKVTVLYFDSEVLKAETFENADELKLEPMGGGGTAFSPIFKHIESEGINPVACVVLTDLCCSDYGDSPAYPVLWVSTDKVTDDNRPPFGDALHISE